ncbi:hypothetical protein AC630_26260 [Bradyrhizobium sp. AS23.2]|nr:hypothetical protein AC630_26260 [Bradyrhizobium sp. AS23.2]
MDRFVAIQAFGHKSLHRVPHWQLGISNLVLDHDMNNSMQLLAREPDPRASMILQDEIDPFLFVQRKPLLRVWLDGWIILPDHAFRGLQRRSSRITLLRPE